MKVLHIISSLEIGGAQRLLSDLLPIQKQQGLDVSLIVLRQKDTVFTKKIQEAGIQIQSLDVKYLCNPMIALKLRKIINHYDIVHSHLVHALYLCSLASIGLNVKLVYTEHSTYNNRRDRWFMRPIEKIIYKRYQKLISISLQTQEALQHWLQSVDTRFVVINNGIDIKRFAAINRPIIPKSLIMVSRFASSKDQETVIKAMKYIDPDATLRLIGDGENLNYCKRVAVKWGVLDRVEFLGMRSDIAELIAESYVGIQASNWEGFGLTAVELMACKKPVIATDVDGLKQVVEGAGEIFHKGDIIGLSEIVNSLLSDKSKYDRLSHECFKRAESYDIEKMANSYMEEYNRI